MSARINSILGLNYVRQGTRAIGTLTAVFSILLQISQTRLPAQGATASLQGSISDATGAVVPEATVKITNVNTGASQTATSNTQGRYFVPDLAVGDYELRVSKQGFATLVRHGLTLTVGAQQVVDMTVEIGAANQTVSVEAAASQVETATAAVGSLMDTHQMADLPLNGRNLEQLIQLAPGVSTIQGNAFTANGFGGRAAGYSIAGSRPEGQAILIDDESMQGFWNRGMGSIAGTSLGVEAIAEFQTLTNTYSAQFGGNGGAVNAVSKSGTNSFHGSAYEYLRNSAMDARSFIDPGSRPPPFRRNQFGGSLGGPVKRDKAFFFVNYEGFRQLLGETKIANVPGCNLNPSNCVPLATVTNPAVRQAITNALAIYPNATSVVNGQPEATTVANQIIHEDYVLARFDYAISSKDSIFGRYISDKSSYTEPYGGGGYGGGPLPFWPEVDDSHSHFSTLEWRRIISQTLVNTARISYSRPSTIEFTAPTVGTGIVNGTDPLQFNGGTRTDGVLAVTGLAGIGGALQLPANITQSHFIEGDDVTWAKGAHNIRFGALVGRLQTNTFETFFSGGEFSFTGLTSGPFPFVGGVPTIVLYVPPGSYFNRDLRQIEFTPYVQDDWKFSRRLTINMGVRWSFITNPIDQHNQLFTVTNFDTAAPPNLLTNVSHVMVINPSRKNFDPRIGLAFDPTGSQKTSIRAGFGIFHHPILPPDYTVGYWTSPPSAIDVVPGAFGVRFPTLPLSGNVAAPSSGPGWNYNTNVTPYQMQWNINIQHEIARNTVLNIGYIGSRGLHLLTENQDNPPTVCLATEGPHCANPTYAKGFEAFAPGGPGGYVGYGTLGSVTSNPVRNPNLAGWNDFGPYANSRYNSGTVSLNRRLTSNVQIQGSYTWSRCMDNGSYYPSFGGTGTLTNPYNWNSDWGPCAWDLNHVARINGLVNLPFHGNRVVEGWQLAGILSANNGYPLNITDGYDETTGGSPVGLTPRPNLNPGCSNNPVLGTANQWYNPTCFSLEAPGTFGNLGRDTVRGPNFVDTDFSVLKDTKVSERIAAQFRAEFFNIFNHTNLGLPNASLFLGGGVRNSSAGQITTYVATPRQIQFALKFIF
jgi:hypothetical protein